MTEYKTTYKYGKLTKTLSVYVDNVNVCSIFNVEIVHNIKRNTYDFVAIGADDLIVVGILPTQLFASVGVNKTLYKEAD